MYAPRAEATCPAVKSAGLDAANIGLCCLHVLVLAPMHAMLPLFRAHPGFVLRLRRAHVHQLFVGGAESRW